MVIKSLMSNLCLVKENRSRLIIGAVTLAADPSRYDVVHSSGWVRGNWIKGGKGVQVFLLVVSSEQCQLFPGRNMLPQQTRESSTSLSACCLICLRFCIIWSLFRCCCSLLWKMFWANNTQQMNYSFYSFTSTWKFFTATFHALFCCFLCFKYCSIAIGLVYVQVLDLPAYISCALFIRPPAHLHDRF